jgi:hypothetical protein
MAPSLAAIEPEAGEDVRIYKHVRLVHALDIGFARFQYAQEHLEETVSVFAFFLTAELILCS